MHVFPHPHSVSCCLCEILVCVMRDIKGLGESFVTFSHPYRCQAFTAYEAFAVRKERRNPTKGRGAPRKNRRNSETGKGSRHFRQGETQLSSAPCLRASGRTKPHDAKQGESWRVPCREGNDRVLASHASPGTAAFCLTIIW